MKRTPMRRVSKRRSVENALYRKGVKVYLDRNKTCAVCMIRRSRVVHHRAGREGRFLLDQRFWMPVCVQCHIEIEENRGWAYANQYLLPRISNPETVMQEQYGE